MAKGHFIWTDLSTYDLKTGLSDYKKLFGWQFGGDGSYSFAQLNGQDVAAIFPMPSRLADMNMPSFWMSYVHVEDVETSVAKARQHEGVVIEVEPQSFGDDARAALVRDPSGAGFTLYEGPDITPTIHKPGTVGSRFHHVSEIGLIRDFYHDLFGWTFTRVSDQPWPTFNALHPDGTVVAQVEEVPETIRGKFKYWMPCFRIESLGEFQQRIESIDGERLSELPGNRVMVADRQGAHFMVGAENSGSVNEKSTSPASASLTANGFAWKALLGLICVWLAVFLDIQAFWGVLFLIWTWPAIRSGRADFVEPVYRSQQPVMYWALIGTWVVLSIWLIAITILI